MTQQDLQTYVQGLVADVLATAEAENATAPDTFTRRVLDDLEQAGEVENTFTAYHRAHGLEVNGYGANQSLGTLDLFITHFSLAPTEDRLSKAQVEALFKRVAAFVRKCRDGLARDIDESSDVHDMCQAVEKTLSDAPRIRLFLLTDVVSTVSALPPGELDGLKVSYEIWDLNRLHRLSSSGTLSEPIVVEFDTPLPCLATPETDRNYSVFLAIIPGQELADLYGRYGTRLLELNVRSFLQTKGGVNRGIRDTLLNNPDRFLAYNNGITATASKVEFTHLPDGGQAISRIHDLQIVNGGQTTASIHCCVRPGQGRSQPGPRADEADPRLRGPAPGDRSGDLQVLQHPEQGHGGRLQFEPPLPREPGKGDPVPLGTCGRRKRTGDPLVLRAGARPVRGCARPGADAGEPAQVQGTPSLGAEVHQGGRGQVRSTPGPGCPISSAAVRRRTSARFMMRMGDAVPDVNVSYAQRLIAKAILFKATDKIVAARNFGGYKINITAYSIARIVEAAGRRIDLDRIWREQRLSPALTAALDELCQPVREVIVTPPRTGTNIGEWAKRPDCWEEVLAIPWQVPDSLVAELAEEPVEDSNPVSQDDAVSGDVAAVKAVPAPEWFALARWAKETQNLEPWQRQVAENLGRYLNNDWEIADRLASQALRAIEEAKRLGFHTTA